MLKLIVLHIKIDQTPSNGDKWAKNSHFTPILGVFFVIRMYRGIGTFSKRPQLAKKIFRERSAILTNRKKRRFCIDSLFQTSLT